MNINIEELKELTVKAKSKSEAAHFLNIKENFEKERKRHEIAIREADLIADDIPDICKKAAIKGKSKVLIASTRKHYNSVIWNSPYNTFKGWDMSNKHGLMFYYLEESIKNSRLAYSIEFQHDGVGIESWFEIYVNWD